MNISDFKKEKRTPSQMIQWMSRYVNQVFYSCLLHIWSNVFSVINLKNIVNHGKERRILLRVEITI